MAERKRFPIIDIEGPATVRLTLEQRFATLSAIFNHQYFETYRIIGERFGWAAANEIALQVPAASVAVVMPGYQRKFGLTGQGAALLSQVLQAEFQAEGSDVAVIEETPDAAEFDVLCSLGDVLQSGKFTDVHIEDGLCHQGCEGWMNDVGATAHPQITAKRLTWMGDGAARCKFRLEAQPEPASAEITT